MVFWSGVLFLLVSATPLREQIALAIPPALRSAAAAGIGLLLTFLGLRNTGVIVGDSATLVRMGALDLPALYGRGARARGQPDAVAALGPLGWTTSARTLTTSGQPLAVPP